MVLSSMDQEYVFQHLECVNPSKSDKIYVIGRTKNGESIACCVKDVQPYFSIQVPQTLNMEAFKESLNKRLYLIRASNRAKNEFNDPDKTEVINVKHAVLISKQLVDVFEFEAQDILQYNENGPLRFFKIVVKSKYYLNDVKAIVCNRRRYIINLQTLTTTNDDNPLTKSVKSSDKRYISKVSKKERLNNKGEQSSVGIDGKYYTLYNEQVDFMLQYFIDRDIYSCGWLKVVGKPVCSKITSCDIELEVSELSEISENGMAPWKILSYDIESLPPPVVGREGKFSFPSSDADPVITIGAIIQQEGHDLRQIVWILKPGGEDVTNLPAFTEEQDCDYKPEITEIFKFSDEIYMLEHFFRWCVCEDIDIIQGHNVNRFDNAYMLRRYAVLKHQFNGRGLPKSTKLKDNIYPVWGRLINESSYIVEKSFSSAQKGTNIQYRLFLPGRVVLDSYDIMKDQHNESSYKLDDLSQKFLGTNKVEMDYASIYPKFHTYQGRIDLAVYCVKDAWLVYKLLDKLCKMNVIMQMANVTGISMKDVMGRGQGIRTIALMLRFAQKRNPQLMLPRVTNEPKIQIHTKIGTTGRLENEDLEVPQSFQGAVVVDPDAGFYTDAVSCLDFASLYPSIMRCMNMSYETLCYRKKIETMKWQQRDGDKGDIRTVPDYQYTDGVLKTTINLDNPSFIVKEKRLGLLPEILATVLQQRKMVKKMMKKEIPHSTMYKVYDGRQLGLKVVANSIYGFTGASFGFLPCKAIAESVTKYGRGMILRTKSKIENHPVWGRNGHGCVCIYGDTDSVFVHMPRSLVDGKNTEELMSNAHKMGEEMANHVTKIFLEPNELEYEKSYSTFLLLKKKRYSGYKYEPGLPPKIQIKGLECARRDYAPITVETQKRVLKALIEHQSTDEALRIVDETVQKLYMNDVPLEMLIMSKKLSRPPEQYKAKAAHVQLTIRLTKNNPSTAPVSGDRVQYVIYAGSGGTSDRACTPDEIKNGKFVVDINYYLTKQLQPPLMRILERVIDNPEQLFKCRSIFKTTPTGIFSSWISGNKRKSIKYVPVQRKRKKIEIVKDIANFFK